MAKMKVFELKNLLNEQYHGNIESKDIQKFLENSMGIKKTHSSNLEDHEVKAVKEHFAPVAKKTSETPATNKVRSASHNSEMGQELTGGNKSAVPTRQSQGQAPRGQVSPQGAGQTRVPTQTYHAGGTRTQGQRPEGSGQRIPQGQRPEGSGQRVPQGQRPDGLGQRVPQGQRPDGLGQRGQQSMRHDGANQSPRGQRPQGGRPQGQRPGASGPGMRQDGVNQARPGGRPAYGASGSPRSQQQGATSRPDGQGYQQRGQRPGGPGQGYQGQGQRPGGQRPDGPGQGRPQGQQGRPYQGDRNQRPQGQDQRQGSYQDNRRAPGQGGYRSDQQQGQRPYGQGQGRPAGQRPGEQRPYSNHGNYQRPQGGQRGGYNRGFETFNKDEDDKPAYGNRSQSARRGSGAQRPNERKDFDQKILDQKVAEKNDNRRNRDRMNKEKQYRDKAVAERDLEDLNNKIPKKGQFIKPKPVVEVKEEIKVITLPEVLTIKELADKMKIPGSALIKKLFLAGQVVTINQEITFEEAEEIALEYDIISEKEVLVNEVEELLKEEEEDEETMVKRPPVVCVMGHVDHGKTSLLDAIRHADVTSREAGGITQHIGAYMVEINGEKITFLDTPGHEAFTSMRMRGAQATDIAILVVAADDGVMPQTVEAISHAKAAGVKIIVAINKIDKPTANVERVKQELTEHELIAEDWGGDTIFVPVSAHTKEGIEQLLEMVLLTAEMEELKANPDRKARGLVIEAELDKGRGTVATILVQKGTLHVGDNIVVGSSYGKVRAMIDDKGKRAEVAGPSTPVEILGLNSVPDVGEIFMATENEKEARNISEAFITQGKEKLISDTKAKLSLDGLFSQIQAGNIKELNLIIKADVQGSVEAMKQSLLKLSNDEVAVRVIHGGVGAINESDVILASTSNGIIIGFNVKADTRAKEIAEHENVDIKYYRVIYNAINDVEAAMKGLLDPVFEEKVTGHAEVRQIFKASSLGTIAGSYVLDGKVSRGNKVRIYRGNELIHEGNLASLKRFQDDVKEVAAGYECGLVFEKFNDIKEEDRVEFYVMVEVPR